MNRERKIIKKIMGIVLMIAMAFSIAPEMNAAEENTTPETYSITYNLNGGKLVSEAPKTYVSTESIKIPRAKRAGYTFAGWEYDVTSVVGSGGLVAGGYCMDTASGLMGDAVFTAKFVKLSVKSKKKKKIIIECEKLNDKYDTFYVKYANNKKMKNAKTIYWYQLDPERYVNRNKNIKITKKKIVISKLKRKKKYYVKIGYRDIAWGDVYEDVKWQLVPPFATRSVKVK